MRVSLLLADYASEVAGKLYIIGGGWSVTGPGPVHMGIAIKLDIPWGDGNRRMPFEIRLLDGDGTLVELPGPLGPQPVVVGGELEAGRPPGLVEGSDLDVALAFNVGPLPLQPGQRYRWEFKVNGIGHEDWILPFSTRRVVEPHPGA